ncbi:MAG TPA: hypothetical protein VOA88_08435 [Candidatus Dormibacteraeota bacterium]|nr:hypothetical protein [Candidatus Dormibacteraeota bacterium]
MENDALQVLLKMRKEDDLKRKMTADYDTDKASEIREATAVRVEIQIQN